MSSNLLSNLGRRTTGVIINHVQRRNMPVNVPPTATGKRRFRQTVETDPEKLVSYCCGLNYVTNSPPVKLKSDNEYPDWLWGLRLGPALKSWQLDKNTKEYYYQLSKENVEQARLLRLKVAKKSKVVSARIKETKEYAHYLRFAALAHLEDDVGIDSNSVESEWFLGAATKEKFREYYLPMNENRVIYKDKLIGNTYLKNYAVDEDSTFKPAQRRVEPHPCRHSKAIQDSKRRHMYSVY